MIEVMKCHVCGSGDVVRDVKSGTYGDGAYGHPCAYLRCYKTVAEKSFFSSKETFSRKRSFSDVKTSVCRDCGTVRFYVEDGKMDWTVRDEK